MTERAYFHAETAVSSNDPPVVIAFLDIQLPFFYTTNHSFPAIDLESAIAKLPVGARTIFVLHDVEGYRHDEIAGMLGGASGTSKTQLHRARKLLREALEQ